MDNDVNILNGSFLKHKFAFLSIYSVLSKLSNSPHVLIVSKLKHLPTLALSWFTVDLVDSEREKNVVTLQWKIMILIAF